MEAPQDRYGEMNYSLDTCTSTNGRERACSLHSHIFRVKYYIKVLGAKMRYILGVSPAFVPFIQCSPLVHYLLAPWVQNCKTVFTQQQALLRFLQSSYSPVELITPLLT